MNNHNQPTHWLILSQTCTFCFQLMGFLHDEDMAGVLEVYGIEMFIASSRDRRLGRKTHIGEKMETTLLWLADNVNESYADQMVLAPVLTLNKADGEGVLRAITGFPAISEYLLELKKQYEADNENHDTGAVEHLGTVKVID